MSMIGSGGGFSDLSLLIEAGTHPSGYTNSLVARSKRGGAEAPFSMSLFDDKDRDRERLGGFGFPLPGSFVSVVPSACVFTIETMSPLGFTGNQPSARSFSYSERKETVSVSCLG